MDTLVHIINDTLSVVQDALVFSLRNEQQKINFDSLNELVQIAQSMEQHRQHTESKMQNNELSGEDLQYVHKTMKEYNNG